MARVRMARWAIGVATATIAASLTFTGPAFADATTTRIVLTQAAPELTHEPGQDAAGADGSVTFFKAKLTRSGKRFGTLSGSIVTHDIVAEGANQETRLRTLVFELPKGQIVAKGVTTYRTGPDFVPLDPREPAVIPIIGGTGAYFGATGELRTTRNANGTYRQELVLAKK
jgi:hypothetical protein